MRSLAVDQRLTIYISLYRLRRKRKNRNGIVREIIWFVVPARVDPSWRVPFGHASTPGIIEVLRSSPVAPITRVPQCASVKVEEAKEGAAGKRRHLTKPRDLLHE
jgi:hypothetical protein